MPVSGLSFSYSHKAWSLLLLHKIAVLLKCLHSKFAVRSDEIIENNNFINPLVVDMSPRKPFSTAGYKFWISLGKISNNRKRVTHTSVFEQTRSRYQKIHSHGIYEIR